MTAATPTPSSRPSIASLAIAFALVAAFPLPAAHAIQTEANAAGMPELLANSPVAGLRTNAEDIARGIGLVLLGVATLLAALGLLATSASMARRHRGGLFSFTLILLSEGVLVVHLLRDGALGPFQQGALLVIFGAAMSALNRLAERHQAPPEKRSDAASAPCATQPRRTSQAARTTKTPTRTRLSLTG